MKVVTVYAAYETTNEYGNLGRRLGIARTGSEAETLAHRKGWYGGNGRVIQQKAIVDALDNIWLLADDSGKPTAFYDDVERKRKEREQLRDKAIAKLTEEELALILEGVKK